MKNVYTSALFKAVALALGFVLAGFGQIAQDHPEICGRRGAVLPVPPGITAISDRSQGITQLSLTIGDSVTKLQLSAVGIEQVCTLPQDRLLVVGETGGAYRLTIIGRQTGAVLDSFYAWDPVMSPDQHWLIMRKFYPVHMGVPFTEEYLLYNLNKNRSGNRLSGITQDDGMEVGTTVYPLGLTNSPGDNTNVPEDQAHKFYSDSFYWAPDSKAVVFADNLNGTLSVVLVTINGDSTKTFVHPITVGEACGDSSKPNVKSFAFNVSQPDPRSLQGSDREIRIPIRASEPVCHVTDVILHSDDFQPAKAEDYPPRQFPPSVGAPEQ